MGSQGLTVLTALLLIIKNYEVTAQYASAVECLPSSATLARPVVQSGGQYILPAIIQPIVPGYDTCVADPTPAYSNYGNFPAPIPGFPPIILEDDSDIWHHLLYFLIFALQNKKANNKIPPMYNNGCNSCSCGCNGSCNYGCCCGCPNCSNNNNNNNGNNNNSGNNNNNNNKSNNDNNGNSMPTYIPIPIAIPVFTGSEGYPYIDPSFPGFTDDIVIQSGSLQAINGKEPNEISLLIRAET